MANTTENNLKITTNQNISINDSHGLGLQLFNNNFQDYSKIENQNVSNNASKIDTENVSNNYPKANHQNTVFTQKRKKIIAKKYKKSIFCLSLIAIIFILFIILIIGQMTHGWFMKSEELLIHPKRQENSVSRFIEIKNSTNSYFYETKNENKTEQNFTIMTDFIVAIKKSSYVINNNRIDYLYESFILIINITEINDTDSIDLGGIDIYDETKSIDDLINYNNDLFNNISLDDNNQTKVNKSEINVPFSKFDFYENGTLDKIYFPPNINEFYKVAIVDLIEKVTPNKSMSLYKDQSNRRRLNRNKEEGRFLNYEQIINNGKLNKTIIYEEKLEKNINKKENENNYERNEIYSNTTRIFDSSGDLEEVKMEGEAIFRSGYKSRKDINLRLNEEKKEKKSETNYSDYNLGINELKMNVTSKMKLTQRVINPVILYDLNDLSQKVKIEGENDSIRGLYTRRIGESDAKIQKIYNQNNSDNSQSQYQNKTINYLCSYKAIYHIISLNFLGLDIDFLQNLYIDSNTGLRQNYLNFIIDKKEYNISTIDIHQYYYSVAQSTSKKISGTSLGISNLKLKYFGLIIQLSLNFNVDLSHGINIDIKDGEMYTKAFSNFDVSISGGFKVEFFIISFGMELKSHITQGDAYIEANTLLNDNLDSTRFLYLTNLHNATLTTNLWIADKCSPKIQSSLPREVLRDVQRRWLRRKGRALRESFCVSARLELRTKVRSADDRSIRLRLWSR